MNNLIKSLTVLLHAIVITAILSNLSMPEQGGTIKSQQNSTEFLYQIESVATTNL